MAAAAGAAASHRFHRSPVGRAPLAPHLRVLRCTPRSLAVTRSGSPSPLWRST